MSELKAAAIKGIKWNTISRAYSALAKVLQVAILTRFLAKEDFGLMGVAMLVNSFCLIFADMGLSAATMHLNNLCKEQFSSFYWLNIFMGFSLTLLAGICSPVVADCYHQPKLVGVISMTCLILFIDSFSTLQRTIQQKKFNFRFMSLVEIASATLMLISNTIFAISGYGVYSLVWAAIINAACRALSYLYIGLVHEKNIRFHFNFQEVKEPLRIGSFMIGSNILDYFSYQMDSLIISGNFTMEMFGIYSLCKSLASRIFQFTNPILSKVLTSVIAKIQSDKDKMSHHYFRSIDFLAAINFPIYSILAFLSYSILFIIYGESYSHYAYMLTCLSIYFAFTSCNDPIGALTISTGRTDYGLHWTIIRLLMYAPYFYLISSLPIKLFAIGVTIIPFIDSYPVWLTVFRRLTTISFFDYFMIPIKPFLCCLPFAPLLYIDRSIDNPFLSLLLLIPLLLLGYMLISFIFRRSIFFEIKTIVYNSIRK